MFTYPYLGDSYLEGFDDKGRHSADSLLFFCDLKKYLTEKIWKKQIGCYDSVFGDDGSGIGGPFGCGRLFWLGQQHFWWRQMKTTVVEIYRNPMQSCPPVSSDMRLYGCTLLLSSKYFWSVCSPSLYKNIMLYERTIIVL